MKTKRFFWIVIIVFAIAIGFYPTIYFIVDMHNKGLLQSKPASLFKNEIWHVLFYIHISFGGLALLCGWSQFSMKLRIRFLNAHRLVGKIYLVSVLLSSLAGLYIAFYASGGIIAKLGFGLLATAWFITGMNAYRLIRKMDIAGHENWMTRNYTLTLAAVTLRIWLPLLQMVFHLNFFVAYPIVAWLCWVPNLLVAEWLISKRNIKGAVRVER